MSIATLLAILALIIAVVAAVEYRFVKTWYALVIAVILLCIAFVLESGFVHAAPLALTVLSGGVV